MNLNDLLKLIKTGESERVEFKRSPGRNIQNVIVALANAEGGQILIGVDDEGVIVGTDAKKSMSYITNSVQSVIPSPIISSFRFVIDKKEVLVIDVAKSDILCSVGGVAYIRIGAGIRLLSIQEILVLASEMGTIEWDSAPLSFFSEAKKDYIEWFFKNLEESRSKKIDEKHRIQYLKSIGALKGEKLTNAGVLFFTHATETLPQVKIRLVYMENEEPIGDKEYEGPVWKIIEDAYADILREIGKTEVVISTKRTKIEWYPSRAIREAIINAVAHRNYLINADIRVFLHPDKIVIRSPGGLVPGVDLDDPEHVPRNPTLCNLLYDTGFIERYGYGIKMIRSEVKQYPGLTLNFNIRSHRFELTIKKDLETLLNETDLRILKILIEPMKSSEISKNIGTTKPTTIHHLKKMEQLGLIKKVGTGPQTKYKLK